MAEESENGTDPRLLAISASIRVVPHFPKPGIMFNDITPLLLRPEAFKGAIEIFAERYRDMEIHAVAGIEARGFMFGSPLALAIGAKFVPLRKPGKLPGEIISEAYALEYGTDCLEMHVGAVQPGERVLVIDDLVATGGTLCAAIKLVERAGAEVVECACLIGLPKFKDKKTGSFVQGRILKEEIYEGFTSCQHDFFAAKSAKVSGISIVDNDTKLIVRILQPQGNKSPSLGICKPMWQRNICVSLLRRSSCSTSSC